MPIYLTFLKNVENVVVVVVVAVAVAVAVVRMAFETTNFCEKMFYLFL